MDEDSFRALWDAHYADILAFCLRRLGDRHEAADAAADTFLTAWRRAGEVPAHPRPWLFGVALKVIANRRRGERRRGALAARLSRLSTTAFAALPDDQPGDVLAAFRMLAPGDQEVLSLVAWEELTPAEAAQVLAQAPATCWRSAPWPCPGTRSRLGRWWRTRPSPPPRSLARSASARSGYPLPAGEASSTRLPSGSRT